MRPPRTGARTDPAPRHRRWPTGVVVAVLLACGGCGLGLGTDDAGDDPTGDAADDDAAAAAEGTPQATAIPTPTPVPVGLEITTPELEAGQCFNRYERVDPLTESATTFFTNVPCTGPHLGEVYAVFDHPAVAGEPYPGKIALDEYARQSCYERFAGFVGAPYELSVYEIDNFHPTADEWDLGPYRTIHCWVFEPGVDTEGSARGTQR